MRGLWVEGSTSYLLHVQLFFFFFFFFKRPAHTHHFHSVRSRSRWQWFCEPRRLWTNVPWRVACELDSLMGSNTLPGQHNQPAFNFIGSGVHACLAVLCHLHFWQNDRGLSRATAVIRGLYGYCSKSQHWKLTREKKNSPTAPARDWTCDFQITRPVFYHWAISLHILCAYQ